MPVALAAISFHNECLALIVFVSFVLYVDSYLYVVFVFASFIILLSHFNLTSLVTFVSNFINPLALELDI